MSSLRPEALTWTGLLAQWVQFAQASLSIPDHADGPRWRSSVPGIITLQAVTFALADLKDLPADEQALGLDKAQLLIEEHEKRLLQIWAEGTRPPSIHEIIRDAEIARAAAQQRFANERG